MDPRMESTNILEQSIENNNNDPQNVQDDKEVIKDKDENAETPPNKCLKLMDDAIKQLFDDDDFDIDLNDNISEKQVPNKIPITKATYVPQKAKPFNWHDKSVDRKVFDLILIHLTPKEILQLTLASTDLNELVGKSEIFMRTFSFQLLDLEVKLQKDQTRLNLQNIMKKSVRNYKHLIVRINEIKDDELGFLLKHNWLTATISITKVKSTTELVKYLGLLLPTLNTLNLSINSISQKTNTSLEISSLKSLSFFQCTSQALEPFCKKQFNQSITQLKLIGIQPSTTGMIIPQIISNILERFEALTHLDIGASEAQAMFLHDFSEIFRFQLKEFRVDAPPSPAVYDNIENFLITQGLFLYEICLLSWMRPSTMFKIWHHMNALVIFQMSNQEATVDFQAIKELVVAKQNLKILQLNFPKSTLRRNFIEPFLIDKSLVKIDFNFADYDTDLVQMASQAAKRVIINGKNLAETEIQDISSDSSSEDFDYDVDINTSASGTPKVVDDVIDLDSD